MSKSTITAAHLEAMGLEETSPGVYSPIKKKSIVNKYTMGVDPVSDSPSRAVIFERSKDGVVRLTEVQDHLSWVPITPESFDGNQNTSVFREPKPFNIAAIRELGSGTKARKESMSMLHKFAVDRVSASNGIFIRGNVASSKNSKTMGFYYEGKGANKKRIPTLVDSPATKNYRKETAADYRKYKDRFLQMAEGKDFPLMVRMTLIRDSLRAFDLINAAQIVQDLMVEYGWIEDDNSEFLVPVFNPTVYYSKDMAGILIEVI